MIIIGGIAATLIVILLTGTIAMLANYWFIVLPILVVCICITIAVLKRRRRQI